MKGGQIINICCLYMEGTRNHIIGYKSVSANGFLQTVQPFWKHFCMSERFPARNSLKYFECRVNFLREWVKADAFKQIFRILSNNITYFNSLTMYTKPIFIMPWIELETANVLIENRKLIHLMFGLSTQNFPNLSLFYKRYFVSEPFSQ